MGRASAARQQSHLGALHAQGPSDLSSTRPFVTPLFHRLLRQRR
jgi:hypothetical protein